MLTVPALPSALSSAGRVPLLAHISFMACLQIFEGGETFKQCFDFEEQMFLNNTLQMVILDADN